MGDRQKFPNEFYKFYCDLGFKLALDRKPESGEDCLGVIIEPNFPGRVSCVPCSYHRPNNQWYYWNGVQLDTEVIYWKEMNDFVPKEFRIGGVD